MSSLLGNQALGVSESTDLRDFRETVWEFYRKHGRRFPWRETKDPYAILVSEIMLQQTQAERVVPKYLSFLSALPTFQSLASAPQADVIRLWSGLGYNRRALALKRCAEVVVTQHGAVLPCRFDDLLKLPGIGPYTANALLAFVFNQAVPVIETNIRSAFIYHFFPEGDLVDDAELLPLITLAIDKENPGMWYQALMDYGSYLKKQGINPSRRSKHHTKQAPLKGSLREARGVILKRLSISDATLREVSEGSGIELERLSAAASNLAIEGFIAKKGQRLHLR